MQRMVERKQAGDRRREAGVFMPCEMYHSSPLPNDARPTHWTSASISHPTYTSGHSAAWTKLGSGPWHCGIQAQTPLPPRHGPASQAPVSMATARSGPCISRCDLVTTHFTLEPAWGHGICIDHRDFSPITSLAASRFHPKSVFSALVLASTLAES